MSRLFPSLALAILIFAGCPPDLGNPPDDDDDLLDDDDATDDDDVTDDDDAVSTDPPGMAWGWWFGECGGGCLGDMTFAADGPVTYAITGWDGETYGLAEAPALNDRGDDLLEEAMDATPIGDLEETYGCPDCADGGGSYFQFDLGPVSLRTEYEYGRAPDELAVLAEAMAAILWDFEACTFEYLEPFDCEPRVVIGR